MKKVSSEQSQSQSQSQVSVETEEESEQSQLAELVIGHLSLEIAIQPDLFFAFRCEPL